ncbi:MAG: methyltransferase domain-containing protein [Pirellulaceae bacterium]|nr:methyltransferase domain-containing protein [Pirellulaceae bacterium]
MSEQGWNQQEIATGFDQAADILHPYYHVLHDKLFELFPFKEKDSAVVVDLGGGSGHFARKVLNEFPKATLILIDQSEPFLNIARRRLAPFGDRALFLCSNLQDNWLSKLPEKADIVVSMSAIHHLTDQEKDTLFHRSYYALKEGGRFANTDLFYEENVTYFKELVRNWMATIKQAQQNGRIPKQLDKLLLEWKTQMLAVTDGEANRRNFFPQTPDKQIDALAGSSFKHPKMTWRRELWALLVADK